MAVQLNHTIVHAPDPLASARFFSEILGLPEPRLYAEFLVVEAANGVSLDFAPHPSPARMHYAFLVSEAEFDEILGRIQARGLPYWADPFALEPKQINHNDGGRGVYFPDPAGHNLEIITRPYGS